MLPKINIVSTYQNQKGTYHNMETFIENLGIPYSNSIAASAFLAPHLWRYNWLYGFKPDILPQNGKGSPDDYVGSVNTDYIFADIRYKYNNAENMAVYWGDYYVLNKLTDNIIVFKRMDDTYAQQRNEICRLTDLPRYLEYLKNTGYTVFISAKDEATRSLTPEIMDQLKEIGVQSDLQGKTRYSYLAVCQGGKSLYEALEPDRLTYGGNLPNGTPYTLESAGFSSGNISSINIGGKEYSVNNRGLNIVVADTQTGEIIDSVCFDTYLGIMGVRNWNF